MQVDGEPVEGNFRSRRPNHVNFQVRGYQEEGTINQEPA